MNRAAEVLKNSRKIVLKIGSNVLAGSDGVLDKAAAEGIVRQVLALMRDGKQVIVVSSGAGVSGAGAIGRQSRRGDINYKQALCAVGQVELMMEYKKHFAVGGVAVGQLLLTAENFADEQSALNIRNTLFTLLDEGVAPIINENDSVSIWEFSFGDNDHLAALTANLWNADLLIIMSDVDGVFDRSPKENEGAGLIAEVSDIDALAARIDTAGTSSFGTGGMDSKLAAARTVGTYGIPLLLVNGRRADVLADVAAGGPSTVFLAE
ncbi:MAG: glutamate 5-kinase [Clostridiales Family XIII bacterium]|jgi:glutamate 5-kinase|nr:glutamate 5-kinase [Clostridiales Family XIII bacterium]